MNISMLINSLLFLLVVIFVTQIIKTIKNKKAANKFVSSYIGDFGEILTKSLNNIDPDDFGKSEDYVKAVFDEMSKNAVNMIKDEAESAFIKGSISSGTSTLIDDPLIDSILNKYITENNVGKDVEFNYVQHNIEQANIEEQEAKLEEEYSDQNSYVEESNDEDLEKSEEVVVPEEELAALNPQRDEEEEFNIEDDSMEIITDEPEIICTTDKNGRELYYEVEYGKKKRVPKDYALRKLGK